MAFRFCRAARSSPTASPPATARRSRRSTTTRRGTSTTTGGPSSPDPRRGRRPARRRARDPHRRGLQPGAVPAAPAQLRRLRRGRGRLREADRQAAPVLRRHQGRRLDGRGGRDQRQGRRRLAHPGLGQVDGDGALRPPRRAAAEAEEPDARGRHRPHRARQPALRGVQPLAVAGREPDQRDARASSCATELRQPHHRRHLLHDAAEVRPDRRGARGRRSTTRCSPTGATSS